MYEASKTIRFSAAHQVRFQGGKCERLHGHDWTVRVTVRARQLDRIGYVLDFTALKHAALEAVDSFDHRNLNEVPPFTDLNPTAENVARHLHEQLARRLNDERVRVHRVEVWETDDNRAAWVDEAPF